MNTRLLRDCKTLISVEVVNRAKSVKKFRGKVV